MQLRKLFVAVIIFTLAGCSGGQAALPPTATAAVATLPPQATSTSTATPTATAQAPTETATPTLALTATPDTRPLPRNWSSWPIVPPVSERVKEIYLKGIQLGVNRQTFSVIGDCQSTPNLYLGIYATDRYILGDKYQYLQSTIDDFKNSFSHESVTVRDGLSAPSVLDPTWNDPKRCSANESPVACELRLSRPMIVFINLGTNWRADASAQAYENYLRQIVDMVIASGAVPILTNKADNVEGDHSIDLVTAQVAYDYDIPLTNFWLAADTLSNHGLDPSRKDIYLTNEALDRRSFVSLETLDAVWRVLKAVPIPGG